MLVCQAATAGMGELEQLTHASGNSKQAWHIPDDVCTVFELLMMGGETAWNMYSIDNNKEDCIKLYIIYIAVAAYKLDIYSMMCLQFLSSWWWAEKPPETCIALTIIKKIV